VSLEVYFTIQGSFKAYSIEILWAGSYVSIFLIKIFASGETDLHTISLKSNVPIIYFL